MPPECESGCVLASPTQADEADGDSEEETSVYYEPAWGEVLAEAFASLVPLDKRNHEVDVPAADDAEQRRVVNAETILDTAPDTKGGTMNFLVVSETEKVTKNDFYRREKQNRSKNSFFECLYKNVNGNLERDRVRERRITRCVIK